MRTHDLAVPAVVKKIAEVLKTAGFEAYLVGGCVRDMVLGREPKDWDITTNATPEKIQSLFEKTVYENKFGTVAVVTENDSDPRLKVIEITPYRIEGKYSNARHPDEVRFSDNLHDDLGRRDFTINAIAYDPFSHILIDEHGGEEDLQRRIVAAVGDPNERFKEDALRTLRAIRIAAELDFIIEARTTSAIARDASLLEKISRERIRDEFWRILMSDRPMPALYMAQKLNILQYIIPELIETIGIQQNQAHSYDVFEHLLRSLQHAADKKWSFEIRLAALLHDIGKPRSRRWSDEKKDWTFHGHEVIGAKMAEKILKDLRLESKIKTVVALIRWHMFFSDPDQVTLSAVRRTITNVGQEHIKDLLNLRICDRIGTGRPKEQPFRLRKYMSMVDEALRDPISVAMLAIDGSKIIEIGVEKPGPRIGWILHALLEEVLDESGKNTSNYLMERAQGLSKMPDEELKKLGTQGKIRREEEDAAAIRDLREQHHVN